MVGINIRVMVDAAEDGNWEQQAEEVESLTYIYPEELEIIQERPYKLELKINTHEEDEFNFLKLILTFDLPAAYPNEVPVFRIKNLAYDYLDNKLIDKYETEMRQKAQDSLGSYMIFELADFLKSELTEINDGVVNALKLAEEKGHVENSLKVSEATSGQKLSYTPVTAETFARWCDQYKERLRLEKSAKLTELEGKPTGKQMFLASK